MPLLDTIAPSREDESCFNCRYYRSGGRCHRHAPKPGDSFCVWPLIITDGATDAWCGEYVSAAA